MLHAIVQALVASPNEAADDVFLQAVAFGVDSEKLLALDALFRRATVHGLSGVIGQYESLPDAHKLKVLAAVKLMHAALRECGRSDDVERRKAALKLIALGRQGKLAYVLSENLHDQNEELSKAAVEALVALSRWVATETKRLQAGPAEPPPLCPRSHDP